MMTYKLDEYGTVLEYVHSRLTGNKRPVTDFETQLQEEIDELKISLLNTETERDHFRSDKKDLATENKRLDEMCELMGGRDNLLCDERDELNRQLDSFGEWLKLPRP